MDQCQKLIKTLQETLKQFPEIKIVTLFGSASTNRLMPNSDIDIAVAADTPLSFDQKYCLMNALGESLSREIDLIDLQAVNGPILQEALHTGIIVKKESMWLFYHLIKKMWLNQADMMPLTRMIIHNRCKRFINNEH